MPAGKGSLKTETAARGISDEREVYTMDFLELAKNRYSERRFDSRPVEREKLDRILEAGRVVPTACNYQPQRFYVMQSKEALEKADKVMRFRYNAPLMILVCYDADTVWRNPKDRRYQDYNSGEQDASIAAATMMYEAEELGIHSLWIRGFDSQVVAETFDLPKNIVPVMLFALGYPSEESKAHPWHFERMPAAEMTTEL